MRTDIKHCQKGFTLVELMVTTIIFLIVIVMAGRIFPVLLGQFKQQSKIAESNIEGNIGLQILRRDIEQAGYGLAYSLPLLKPDGITNTYTEAGVITNPFTPLWTASKLNDGPPNNPLRTSTTSPTNNAGSSNPPGAVRALTTKGLNLTLNDSAVLALKAVNIGTSDTVQKSTNLSNYIDPATKASLYTFGSLSPLTAEQFADNERVIVIRPENAGQQKILITDHNGNFYARYHPDQTATAFRNDASFPNDDFFPLQSSNMTYIIYGISPAPSPVNSLTLNLPRMPFNVAYYYVRRPTDIPSRCEPSIGVLYKAVLSNDNTVNDSSTPKGSPTVTEYPLLDCVADMQLVFGLASFNADGSVNNTPSAWIDSYSSDFNALTAADIRFLLKEVRVYIIAQEGQIDMSYTYTNPNPVAGCAGANMVCINDVSKGLIRAFTVPSVNYRWKLYTMILTPYSL